MKVLDGWHAWKLSQKRTFATRGVCRCSRGAREKPMCRTCRTDALLGRLTCGYAAPERWRTRRVSRRTLKWAISGSATTRGTVTFGYILYSKLCWNLAGASGSLVVRTRHCRCWLVAMSASRRESITALIAKTDARAAQVFGSPRVSPRELVENITNATNVFHERPWSAPGEKLTTANPPPFRPRTPQTSVRASPRAVRNSWREERQLEGLLTPRAQTAASGASSGPDGSGRIAARLSTMHTRHMQATSLANARGEQVRRLAYAQQAARPQAA